MYNASRETLTHLFLTGQLDDTAVKASTAFFQMVFPQLHTFHLGFCNEDAGVPSNLISFLRSNPTIEDLSLGFDISGYPVGWLDPDELTSDLLPRLIHLQCDYVVLTTLLESNVKSITTTLRVLSLGHCRFDYLVDGEEHLLTVLEENDGLSNIQTLKIIHSVYMRHTDLSRFFVRLGNVKAFNKIKALHADIVTFAEVRTFQHLQPTT